MPDFSTLNEQGAVFIGADRRGRQGSYRKRRSGTVYRGRQEACR